MSRRWLAATALASLVALAGCSHGSQSSSGSLDGAVAKAPAATAAAGTAGSAPGKAEPAVQQRAFVRTATVSLRTKDVNAAANGAAQAAKRAGGRVDGDTRTDGGTAHLVLRVPSTKLDAAITALDALGTETSRTIEGTDVTAKQADTDARTRATATSVGRLESLLARSAKLADLLTLETQLTQRQSELESMQAQQRALADQIALASITLDISSLSAPPPPQRASGGPTGFGGALAAGWHGLVLAGRWVAAVVGYALPTIALVALLALATRSVLRRRTTLAGTVLPPQQ